MCNLNCIVVNPGRSKFLSFNTNNASISLNGQWIANTNVAKYLGLLIDNKLSWSYHVTHIIKICCQRIEVFKKVMPYSPNYVLRLYYNSSIKSCFSYCLMFWINNEHFGRYKLIDKIDKLIT